MQIALCSKAGRQANRGPLPSKSVPMVYNIDSPGHVISEDGLLADLDGVSERSHKVPRRTA